MNIKRILIVEDDKLMRFSLERDIKKLSPDYQVVFAENGLAALVELRRQSFDMMITDYKMPGMTGMKLAQTVRQILPDMRVVMMSAQDIIEIRNEARQWQLNFDGYLSKPFTLAQLSQVVK